MLSGFLSSGNSCLSNYGMPDQRADSNKYIFFGARFMFLLSLAHTLMHTHTLTLIPSCSTQCKVFCTDSLKIIYRRPIEKLQPNAESYIHVHTKHTFYLLLDRTYFYLTLHELCHDRIYCGKMIVSAIKINTYDKI